MTDSTYDKHKANLKIFRKLGPAPGVWRVIGYCVLISRVVAYQSVKLRKIAPCITLL